MHRWVGGHRGALALVLVVAACSGGGGDDDPAASGTATTDPEPTTTTTEPPPLVGKPLVVVEQGVSSFPDPFDPSSTLGGYGVVIENPDPELVATGVRVVTRILDAEGTELLVDRALVNGIMPKQRMAVGRTVIEPIEEPTVLDVKVEVTAWLEPAYDKGSIKATDVVTEPEPNGGSVTKFTLRSTWPEAEDGVDVTAIYRAADGRLLAAETTTVASVPSRVATPGQIRLLSPIPDLATTEVFVGRGIAAQTTG